MPKLSNFASDIDVFVIFSCPFGIILDASDYYQPIVSMFEAEIALNPSKEWAAAHGWTSECRTFINGAFYSCRCYCDISALFFHLSNFFCHFVLEPVLNLVPDTIGEVADEVPDVSLVTGRIRGGQRTENREDKRCNQISLYNAGNVVFVLTVLY